MNLLRIAEVFGHSTDNHSTEAKRDRQNRICPFRGSQCTKGNRADPLGICSLTNGDRLATLCPVRFVQDAQVFRDAARLAFGAAAAFAVVPEVRILQVRKVVQGRERMSKVGKVDYLIAKLDRNRNPIDFAALEVQSVYFSGGQIRSAFDGFMRTGRVGEDASRRPDWRSSAQKRLMPQLSLKIPVFRRWGRKFFVAVDSLFFGELPTFRAANDFSNSEITWLVYPFASVGSAFTIGSANVVYSTWDDVQTALREGEAPTTDQILDELRRKISAGRDPRLGE